MTPALIGASLDESCVVLTLGRDPASHSRTGARVVQKLSPKWAYVISTRVVSKTLYLIWETMQHTESWLTILLRLT